MQTHNFIRDDVEFDVSKLSKGLQDMIKKMEKADQEKDDISYNAYYDALETGAKNALMSGYISEKQYSQIEKKYGGYV